MTLPGEAQSKLLAYAALLYKWNKTYSLTAMREQEKAVSHHLLDSLTIRPLSRAADCSMLAAAAAHARNSSGYCPARATSHPARQQFEKVGFLQQAAIELALPNEPVHRGRVEQYQVSFGFEAITSRAFSELADFVRLSQHLLAPGGLWLAMKGVWPHDEIARLPLPM